MPVGRLHRLPDQAAGRRPPAGDRRPPRPAPARRPRAPAALTSEGAAPADLPSLLRSDITDESVRGLLARFVEDLPGRVHEMQCLLDRGDLESLRGSLHRLRGTGGLFGLMPLTDCAGRAEDAIRGASPLEQVSAEVRGLIALIRRVEGYQPAREQAAGA